MNKLRNFHKKKDYLICIDSDGCAMDSMYIKHCSCFGPCLVYEWKLNINQDAILERWNEINLYDITRGVSRFIALTIILRELYDVGYNIEGIEELEEWVGTEKNLNNETLKERIREHPSTILEKALRWSETVNEDILALKNIDAPIKGAELGFEAAATFADVAVISSATEAALEYEWKGNQLEEYIDVFMSQKTGTKAYCMEEIKSRGYNSDKILMVGDSLRDYEAAQKSGILFFPILVGKERDSWNTLTHEGFRKLQEGTFDQEYQEKILAEFFDNFRRK